MTTPKPQIVTPEEWETARMELLKEEKAATKLLDALAAKRRRLPMTKFQSDYTFDTPTGPKTLLDLFDGRRQLVIYQFMNNGPDDYCPGCTALTDNVPEHGVRMLADRGISWVTVSTMPLTQIEAYKAQRGWKIPFVSCAGTTFADDHKFNGGWAFSVFLRDGDQVYRTYSTSCRGNDRWVFMHNIQDMSVYGRQQEWEDSPEGWPQFPTYGPPAGF